MFLKTSQQFTLYSLEPKTEVIGKIAPGEETFHRNKVLGKILITDPEVKAELVNALYRGIAESDGSASACFNPRHGIRAVKGWRTIDLEICFECSQVHFWENDKGINSATIAHTNNPQKVFDQVLKSGKIPLGKRRD
jgi:hypothetical protein